MEEFRYPCEPLFFILMKLKISVQIHIIEIDIMWQFDEWSF